MEENKDNVLYCSHCGTLIGEDEDFEAVNGEVVCIDCFERHTTTCDRCGETIWTDDRYGDEYTTLCHHCYENHYTRCSCCDTLIHEDDAYHLDGYDYCSECYHDEVDRNRSIHDYGYKPEPIFYGDSPRYFGVELEIDGAGKDSDNADEILAVANKDEETIYIKGDGSLDDGMEIVSHPMSLEYHKQFCWQEIMSKAISMGYRSHQTSTCGLHLHINRNCFGEDRDTQDEVISRILYFVEHHWNEMLKFSRRTEYSMNRWAARYEESVSAVGRAPFSALSAIREAPYSVNSAQKCSADYLSVCFSHILFSFFRYLVSELYEKITLYMPKLRPTGRSFYILNQRKNKS